MAKSGLFQKEVNFLNKAKMVVQSEKATKEEIAGEYENLCSRYENLLGEVQLLTSISDRLHLKLNHANDKLQNQANEIQKINQDLKANNHVLQETINQLVRAKVGRKASTIVLLIAIILFLISEALLEPAVESYTNDIFVGLLLKGIIALSLKPIDILVEKSLMRQAIKKRRKYMTPFQS